MSDILSAENNEDLTSRISKISMRVPPRSQGRTSDDTEKWALFRLLITFGGSSLVDFPLRLIHRDKPDFELRLPSHSIGIEFTEAVTEQFARALTLREVHFPGGAIEPTLFGVDAPPRTNAEILEILQKSQNRLIGRPSVGNKPEQDWVRTIRQIVGSKTSKLNQNYLKEYLKNWLLIYDNLPIVPVDFNHIYSLCSGMN